MGEPDSAPTLPGSLPVLCGGPTCQSLAVPRKPDTPCSACGKLLYSGTTSLPPEQRTCRPCRATGIRWLPTSARWPLAERQPGHVVACPCGRTVRKMQPQTYCSLACVARFTVNGPPRSLTSSHKCLQRRNRERDAPGLTAKQRGRLLAKWKRQRRACWACPRPADTVDHLVPLARGGTNHEGNLAGACRRCNGARGARLIVEWRAGRPAPRRPTAVAPGGRALAS